MKHIKENIFKTNHNNNINKNNINKSLFKKINNTLFKNILSLVHYSIFSFTTKLIKRSLCIILSYFLFLNNIMIMTIQASTVDHIKQADYEFNITIDRSQNNTPILNINNSNNDGISKNDFTDYNVNNENLIINNSKQNVDTNLGGVIAGNINMQGSGGRQADIILNEVISNNITKLEGWTGIAGKKAELIIANPNGIYIKGAGFINTNKLNLINGKSIDNNINNFDLNYNNINNEGIVVEARDVYGNNNQIVYLNLGLDISQIDYTALLSKYIEVKAQIVGNNSNELNLKTGNNKAVRDNNNNTYNVSSNNNVDNDNIVFAIDSKNFGGMYAGKINFIVSQNNKGINIENGNLVSNLDNIEITTEGDVIINDSSSIKSAQDITIISKQGNITLNNKEIIANNNINLNIDNDVVDKVITNNTELISINNDININNNKGIVNNNNTIISNKNNINISSKILNNNNALIYANKDINLNIDSELNNMNNSLILSNIGDINISGNVITTPYGNVNKLAFYDLEFNKEAELYNVLLNNGYIDNNGNITNLFKTLTTYTQLELTTELNEFKEQIFNLLKSNNPTIDNYTKLTNLEIEINKQELFNTLVNNGYYNIDTNTFTDLYYTDLNNNTLQLGKYELLTDEITAILDLIATTQQEQQLDYDTLFSTLYLSPINESKDIIQELFNNGYIDNNYKLTNKFKELTTYEDLTIETNNKNQIIYNILQNKLTDTISENTFNTNINIKNEELELYNELISKNIITTQGYINNIDNLDNIDIKYSLYKDQIKVLLLNITTEQLTTDKIKNNITIDTKQLSNTIYNELLTLNYINTEGNLTNKITTLTQEEFKNTLSTQLKNVSNQIYNKLQEQLNNTTITKYTELLNNIQSTIQTKQGKITIKTNELNNIGINNQKIE